MMEYAARHEFDHVLVGRGAALLHLAARFFYQNQSLRLAVLLEKQAISGFELLFPAHIPNPIKSILDNALIGEWPNGLVQRNGKVETIDEVVWVVDLAQLQIELAELIGESAIFVNFGDLVEVSGMAFWNRGRFSARSVRRAKRTFRENHAAEVLKDRDLAALTKPVLADFDLRSAPGDFMQYIPLDHQRAWIVRMQNADGLEHLAPEKFAQRYMTLAGW